MSKSLGEIRDKLGFEGERSARITKRVQGGRPKPPTSTEYLQKKQTREGAPTASPSDQLDAEVLELANSGDKDFQFQAGDTYEQQGDLDNAIRYYEMAARQNEQKALSALRRLANTNDQAQEVLNTLRG